MLWWNSLQFTHLVKYYSDCEAFTFIQFLIWSWCLHATNRIFRQWCLPYSDLCTVLHELHKIFENQLLIWTWCAHIKNATVSMLASSHQWPIELSILLTGLPQQIFGNLRQLAIETVYKTSQHSLHYDFFDSDRPLLHSISCQLCPIHFILLLPPCVSLIWRLKAWHHSVVFWFCVLHVSNPCHTRLLFLRAALWCLCWNDFQQNASSSAYLPRFHATIARSDPSMFEQRSRFCIITIFPSRISSLAVLYDLLICELGSAGAYQTCLLLSMLLVPSCKLSPCVQSRTWAWSCGHRYAVRTIPICISSHSLVMWSFLYQRWCLATSSSIVSACDSISDAKMCHSLSFLCSFHPTMSIGSHLHFFCFADSGSFDVIHGFQHAYSKGCRIGIRAHWSGELWCFAAYHYQYKPQKTASLHLQSLVIPTQMCSCMVTKSIHSHYHSEPLSDDEFLYLLYIIPAELMNWIRSSNFAMTTTIQSNNVSRNIDAYAFSIVWREQVMCNECRLYFLNQMSKSWTLSYFRMKSLHLQESSWFHLTPNNDWNNSACKSTWPKITCVHSRRLRTIIFIAPATYTRLHLSNSSLPSSVPSFRALEWSSRPWLRGFTKLKQVKFKFHTSEEIPSYEWGFKSMLEDVQSCACEVLILKNWYCPSLVISQDRKLQIDDEGNTNLREKFWIHY